MKKIRFGAIHADYITQAEALEYIIDLAKSGKGGYIVTPNIDHVVLAQKNRQLRNAYAQASLSLVDGMPLKWMSALVGEPLPEKVSGSDLVRPLLQRAAISGLRVYFLGAASGVAQTAADKMISEIPDLNIVGVDSPPLGFEKDPKQEQATIDKMMSTEPNIVMLALGCPKQELTMHKWHKTTAPIVYLGIGATLDFIANKVKRAPSWMSDMGLEWVYRISQDPKRMLHRYLVRDAAIAPIFLKMLRAKKSDIVFWN
ncbi:MAG: WecB/TagA/CpsF family glycosyltransferase [Deltaproteobacteria bacterium]|nr:WecB/TagA/CpsF family glycosyltransferase [Deltaproteobacteria bacterium]